MDDEKWLAVGMAAVLLLTVFFMDRWFGPPRMTDEARGLIRVEGMQISPVETPENKGENEQVDESGPGSSKLVHPETNKIERTQNEPAGENR